MNHVSGIQKGGIYIIKNNRGKNELFSGTNKKKTRWNYFMVNSSFDEIIKEVSRMDHLRSGTKWIRINLSFN